MNLVSYEELASDDEEKDDAGQDIREGAIECNQDTPAGKTAEDLPANIYSIQREEQAFSGRSL